MILTEIESASQDMLERIGRLRVQAWRGIHAADPADDEVELDEHDQHALHVIAMAHSGELVASARVCCHDAGELIPDRKYFDAASVELAGRYAFLNRLTVHPAWRGRGTARALLVRRLAWARGHSCKGALVCVRDEVAGPFLRLHAVELGTVTPVWLPDWKLPQIPRRILLLPLHGN